MTLPDEEEQFIKSMDDYAMNVRRYDRQRILRQSRSVRHILNQLSLDLVIYQLSNAESQYDYDHQRYIIFRSLVSEGEISTAARPIIYNALDEMLAFSRWKEKAGGEEMT